MRRVLTFFRRAELNPSLLYRAGNLPDGSPWSFWAVGMRQLPMGNIHD